MIDIRPIRLGDVDACRKIILANWDLAVANRFMREISNVWADMEDPPIYYVALLDNQLLGFAGMTPSWIMRGVWEFTWCNVHPAFHGEGIGRKLVEYRIEEVRRCDGRAIHLMTRQPAFFEQFQFQTIQDYGAWQLMGLTLGAIEL